MTYCIWVICFFLMCLMGFLWGKMPNTNPECLLRKLLLCGDSPQPLFTAIRCSPTTSGWMLQPQTANSLVTLVSHGHLCVCGGGACVHVCAHTHARGLSKQQPHASDTNRAYTGEDAPVEWNWEGGRGTKDGGGFFFSIDKQYFWSPGASATPESGKEPCGTEAKRHTLVIHSCLWQAASNNW